MKVALVLCVCLLAALATASEEHEEQIHSVEDLDFASRKLAAANEDYEDQIEAVQEDGLASRMLLDDFGSFGRPGKPFGPKPRRPGRPFPFKLGRPGPKPFGPKKPFRGLKLAGDNEEYENEIEAVQSDGLTSRQLLDDFGSFGRPGKPFGPKPRRPGRPFPFKPSRPGPKPFGPKKPFRGLKLAGDSVEHEDEIEVVQHGGFSWRQLLGKPFGRKPGPKPPKKLFPRRPFPGKKHG